MSQQTIEDPTVPVWTLGDRFRKARLLAEIDQATMATHFGVTPGAISSWEIDRSRPRDLPGTVAEWAKLTNVDREWLLWGVAAPRGGGAPREQGSEISTCKSQMSLNLGGPELADAA